MRVRRLKIIFTGSLTGEINGVRRQWTVTRSTTSNAQILHRLPLSYNYKHVWFKITRIC